MIDAYDTPEYCAAARHVIPTDTASLMILIRPSVNFDGPPGPFRNTGRFVTTPAVPSPSTPAPSPPVPDVPTAPASRRAPPRHATPSHVPATTPPPASGRLPSDGSGPHPDVPAE